MQVSENDATLRPNPFHLFRPLLFRSPALIKLRRNIQSPFWKRAVRTYALLEAYRSMRSSSPPPPI